MDYLLVRLLQETPPIGLESPVFPAQGEASLLCKCTAGVATYATAHKEYYYLELYLFLGGHFAAANSARVSDPRVQLCSCYGGSR